MSYTTGEDRRFKVYGHNGEILVIVLSMCYVLQGLEGLFEISGHMGIFCETVALDIPRMRKAGWF